MSNDIDDCITDSNLLLNAEEIEQEFQGVASGKSEDDVAEENDSPDDSADDIVDDECVTDGESEVAMITEGASRMDTDDGSLSPSTTGGVDTSTSATSDQNDTTGKSRTEKKPVKRFSPFRNSQVNRAFWNSSCKIKSSSSNSSGETSEDSSASSKKVTIGTTR